VNAELQMGKSFDAPFSITNYACSLYPMPSRRVAVVQHLRTPGLQAHITRACMSGHLRQLIHVLYHRWLSCNTAAANEINIFASKLTAFQEH